MFILLVSVVVGSWSCEDAARETDEATPGVDVAELAPRDRRRRRRASPNESVRGRTPVGAEAETASEPAATTDVGQAQRRRVRLRILDSSGDPIGTSARVRVLWISGRGEAATDRTLRLDDDGRVETELPAYNEYTVVVAPSDDHAGVERTIVPSDEEITIVVGSGAYITGNLVGVPRAVSAIRSLEVVPEGGLHAISVNVERDGSFRTPRLDLDQEYVLVARTPTADGIVRHARPGGSYALQIVATDGVAFAGTVTWPDGRAVGAGVSVWADAVGVRPGAYGSPKITVTNGTGQFESKSLPGFEWRLSAGGGTNSGGYGVGPATAPLTIGQTDVQLTVTIGESIEGTLRSEGGSPLGSVLLSAALGDGPFRWSAWTNADGSFAFHGLPDAEVQIFAARRRPPLWIANVTAPQKSIQLVLPAPTK